MVNGVFFFNLKLKNTLFSVLAHPQKEVSLHVLLLADRCPFYIVLPPEIISALLMVSWKLIFSVLRGKNTIQELKMYILNWENVE